MKFIVCLLIFIILVISCNNSTEPENKSIFVYRNVNTELLHNDIDAKITFVTDTLIDEHGYYYTVQMPTVNILLKDSLLRLDEAMFFHISYDKVNYEEEGGLMAGSYIFPNLIIFTYTPRLAGYDKLYILAKNYGGDKIYFDVCIRYK